MKKIVISIILTLLFINLVCLVIFLGNLYTIERHFNRSIIINESLNSRLELYSKILELNKAKNIKGAGEEIARISEEIKKTLSSCNRCHYGSAHVVVVNAIEELQKELDILKKNKKADSFLFLALEDFGRMAFEKARLSFVSTTGEFRASLNITKITLFLISLTACGIIIYFSSYSLRKVTLLENDIKEREKTITDWALQWQNTFDAVKDMIIIFDKEKRPVQFNMASKEFFKEALLRDDFCRLFFNMECACPTSKIVTLKGRIFDIRTYMMQDSLKCIVILRDITEHKEAEERLKKAERLSSLGLMAGGIAHEINNPLTAVIGYSKLLLDQERGEEKKIYLDQILSSAKRIQRIVNSLLILGRKGELRIEDVMLEDLLDVVLKDFKNLGDIKIIKKFSGAGSVRIDRGLFELVFRNLLNNAIEAIRDSSTGDAVEIKTSRYNDLVKIEVSDNGPGIPEDIISKIFDPFFTTKEIGKGSGLGLAIVHNIIVAHKGEISVRSKVGEGTTFTITVPSC